MLENDPFLWAIHVDMIHSTIVSNSPPHVSFDWDWWDTHIFPFQSPCWLSSDCFGREILTQLKMFHHLLTFSGYGTRGSKKLCYPWIWLYKGFLGGVSIGDIVSVPPSLDHTTPSVKEWCPPYLQHILFFCRMCLLTVFLWGCSHRTRGDFFFPDEY